ncbi:Cyclic nucleotide-binding protein [Pseudocohnilembus persalinus]|uniref:Cyclic nucleotide-binding protein n=1 Tax=Pseudocohnilembus persalinus TaxID=266149 RepID=A0A0V0QUY0_PSEPJ|nr:Cyclic nucleotide-binding protein [Pseudocohnilembus persalinus]|eukprot:KRX05850.1 Cyclic nucleotide-binding protein [Pseudocohnilembus persalinus]
MTDTLDFDNDSQQLKLPQIDNKKPIEKKYRSISTQPGLTKHQCGKHMSLCGQCFEISDQTNILKDLNQPHIERYNKPLKTPHPEEKRQKNIKLKNISEESLDDWIAQSLNRPIVSFLDPYKKFYVPDTLLKNFKRRYKKLYDENPDKDDQKKRLYFEQKKPSDNLPHYMRPIRQPKEMQKDLRVDFHKLRPKPLEGKNISQREEQSFQRVYESFNLNSVSGMRSASFGGSKLKNPFQQEFDPSLELKTKDKLYDPSFSENKRNNRYNDYINTKELSKEQKKEYADIIKLYNHRPKQSNLEKQIFLAKQNRFSYASQNQMNNKIHPYRVPDVRSSENQDIIETETEASRPGSQQSQKDQNKANLNNSVASRENNYYQANNSYENDQNTSNILPHDINDTNPNISIQNQYENYENNNNNNNKKKKPQLFDSNTIKDQVIKLLQERDRYINYQPFSQKSNPLWDLNLHVQFIHVEVPQEEKTELSEVEYLYWRGVRRILNNKFNEAIACFKENLYLHPEHFKTIFNLAVCYQKTHRFSLAQKWFCLALQFNQEVANCRFAISLSLYKQGKFQEALKYIEEINYPSNFQFKHITYLRIVCLKQLGRISEIGQNFQKFIKLTCPKNYTLLMNFMFSMMFANLRGMQVKFAPLIYCDFTSLTYSIADSIDFKPKLQQYLKDEFEFKDQIKQLNFFKRFSNADIDKHMYTFFNSVKYLQKGDVINVDPGKIMIITAGTATIWDHIKDYDKPTILHHYHEGDIIGDDQKDNGMLNRTDVFVQVISKQLEFVEIDKEIFQDLWKCQYNYLEQKNLYQFLKNQTIFKGISEFTLYKLAYEFMNEEKFRTNDVIFNSGQTKEDEIKYIKVVPKDKQAEEQKLQRQNTYIKERLKEIDNNQTKFNGFYILQKGNYAELQSIGGIIDYTLKEGDYLGENLLFNVESLTKLGKIVAKSDPCKCYYLSRDDFDEINLLDREIMKKNIINSQKYADLLQLFKIYEQKRNKNNK